MIMIPDPSHVPAGIYFEHDPQQRFHDHFEYLAEDGGFAQTQNQHRYDCLAHLPAFAPARLVPCSCFQATIQAVSAKTVELEERKRGQDEAAAGFFIDFAACAGRSP